MKDLLKAFGVTSLFLLAAACNTVEGVGQDVEAAGEEIEETADANKPD